MVPIPLGQHTSSATHTHTHTLSSGTVPMLAIMHLLPTLPNYKCNYHVISTFLKSLPIARSDKSENQK